MLHFVEPRFFSLDTSHWVGLLISLGEKASRSAAIRRLRKLFEEGWLPAISFHQIQELLAHDDERVAISRLSALRHVPTLATIGEMDSDGAPGSIVEVQRKEILAAVDRPTDQAQAVRQCVRASVFRVTTGDAVVEAMMPVASFIREHTLATRARTRAISSISQATVLDQDNMPFHLNGVARSLPEIASHFAGLSVALANELAERGDHRLVNPVDVAKEFVDDLTSHTPNIAGSDRPVVEILKLAGLTPEDVLSCKTVGQVTDLAHFRRNVEIATKNAGIAASAVRSLSQDRVPTWVVHRALQRHRAVATEAQGGDLTDGHLLALAPYFHTTFVDKRTLENVRRIRQHDAVAGDLIGDVRKASSWSKAFDLLLNR
jgi:hypothetical protein